MIDTKEQYEAWMSKDPALMREAPFSLRDVEETIEALREVARAAINIYPAARQHYANGTWGDEPQFELSAALARYNDAQDALGDWLTE